MRKCHERKKTGGTKHRHRYMRVLAAMLCLCLMVTSCPYMPEVSVHAAETEPLAENDSVMLADDSEHTSHTGWTALSSNNTDTSTFSGGKYYLTKDIEMGTITIDGEVTLCLNGHTLKHYGETDCVIVVKGGTFTLCDCSGNDSGSIMNGKGHLKGDNLYYGGGVCVKQDATFHMYGGVIKDNTVAQGGGGVHIEENATFYMHGGKIIGNTVSSGYGGGIRCQGNLIIEGGSIEENEASRGGGIFLERACEMSLSNVSILNNRLTSGNYGGGIFTDTQAIVNISDNVKVIGNWNASNQTNNFYLRNNLYIHIIGNLENSDIGVTVQKQLSESSPTVKIAGGDSYTITETDWHCFTSDNRAYKVVKDGNDINLALPESCDLSGLTLSTENVTLSPGFQADETSYTATAASDVDEVGITATLARSTEGQSITIKKNGGSGESMTSGE